MVVLDVTIVNVALPQIGTDLNGSRHVDWIITGYLLAVATVQPSSGWLADRFGKRKVFLVSQALFAVGSALCALAPGMWWLVGFRMLQGFGGGALIPISLSIIYELFPVEQRGRALGIWGIAAMAAPAIGPVLGGFLVTVSSWRWLFVINVPIGIAGVLVARRQLRDIGYREHRPFDWPSSVLAASGLVAILLAFNELPSQGGASAAFLVPFAVGVLLLAVFVWRSLRIEHPLMQLRIFAARPYALAVGISCLVVIAIYARLTFIPIELETIHGKTALVTGALLVPSAAGAAVSRGLAGRLADSVGAKVPVVCGLALLAVVMWQLAHLSVDTPVWEIATYLGVAGFGTGFGTMPAAVVGMNALPERFISQASAARSVSRRVAATFGIAVLSAIVAAQIGTVSAAEGATTASAAAAQSAYNLVFLAGAAACVIGIPLALALPGRTAARQLQEDRRQDAFPADDEQTQEQSAAASA